MNDRYITPVRVLLINATLPEFRQGTISLHNLTSLGSYLLEHGIVGRADIEILSVLNEDPVPAVRRFRPDVVGISAVTPAYIDAIELAKRVRSVSDAVIVLGGHHISGAPESLDPVFDFGVIGEGEETLADIVSSVRRGRTIRSVGFRRIPNLVYRDDAGKVRVNPMRPLLPGDKVPRIRWDLLPPYELYRNIAVVKDGVPMSVRFMNMFTSRGCPYRCTFCSRQIMYPNHSGFRMYPVSRVVDDIEELYRSHGISCLWLIDDTFAVTKQRVRDIIAEMRRRGLLGLVMFYRVYVRANLIDAEFVRLLSELGVISVSLGIESGSERILAYLKAGSLKVRDVKRAIRLFAVRSILVSGSFMLFSPEETSHDIDRTYALARWFADQSNTYEMEVYITGALPATKLWFDAVRMGIIDPKNVDWSRFRREPSILERLRNVHFGEWVPFADRVQYWRAFALLSERIVRRLEALPGWAAAERKTRAVNDRLIGAASLRMRMERILLDPMRVVRKLCSPVVWRGIAEDVRAAVSG